MERSAHAPQQSTHRMEYQNHRDFKASRKAIQRNILPIEERRVPELMRKMQSRDRRNNQVQMVRESFLRGRNNNVPVSHPSLLATLKVDRPRRLFVAVKGATGNPRNLLVVDDGLTILDNRDHTPDQGDIKGLPFSGLARQLRRGGKESVHPARMVTGRLLRGVGFNLHLVAAPQIDTTVGFWRTVELQMQLEILKFGNSNSLCSPSGTNECAVFDLPTACPAWITEPPAGEIFAFE